LLFKRKNIAVLASDFMDNLTALDEAIAAFNQQKFYDCHDLLEAMWMDACYPEKTFYQGLLQITVGLYHLGNLNWNGSKILLGEGIGRLRDYQPEYAGIDVTQLIQDSFKLLSMLQRSDKVELDRLIIESPMILKCLTKE
jgi:uncharacterized protein